MEYDFDVEKMADTGEVRGASGSFDPISRPAPRALRDRQEEATNKNLNTQHCPTKIATQINLSHN